MTDDLSIVTLPTEKKHTLQAADWLAKFDRDDLTAEERAAFADWLAEDPQNKDSIRQAAGLWYGMNEPLSRIAPTAASEERDTRVRHLPLALFGPAIARLRIGAFVLTFLIAALVTANVLLSPPSVDVKNYFTTNVGETRIVHMSDGSSIHLNTNSIVDQSYTKETRIIRLIAGEAIFDVAHDKERPFLVYAADGVIRAVGTRFAVRVAKDQVRVTVTDGQVALARRSDDSVGKNSIAETTSKQNAPIMVSKGEIAGIGRVEKIVPQTVSENDLAERLSWATGQLVFYDEELQSVIEEVARYTTVKIRVMDDALKGRRISGILQIGDVDLMLEGIEGAFNVKVNRVETDLVYLTAI